MMELISTIDLPVPGAIITEQPFREYKFRKHTRAGDAHFMLVRIYIEEIDELGEEWAEADAYHRAWGIYENKLKAEAVNGRKD